MLKLDNLPKRKSIKKKTRVGRGHGSGLVKTAGRGQKGQTSRSDGTIHPSFMGGSLSLYRTTPKLGGFRSINKIDYIAINVADLDKRFNDGDEVNLATLCADGAIKKSEKNVKILGNGEITKKLNIKVQAWSKSAEEKIKAAGGSIEKV